jgi:hypothetical protein
MTGAGPDDWIAIPVQTDPFGDGLVVYLGLAAPVKPR